jgi:hypothetical protein
MRFRVPFIVARVAVIDAGNRKQGIDGFGAAGASESRPVRGSASRVPGRRAVKPLSAEST